MLPGHFWICKFLLPVHVHVQYKYILKVSHMIDKSKLIRGSVAHGLRLGAPWKVSHHNNIIIVMETFLAPVSATSGAHGAALKKRKKKTH